MNHCIRCGGESRLAVPDQDNRERYICQECGYIRYENPHVIVCVVAAFEDKILWMQRAEEPMRGYWSLPSGHLEMDESLQEAAARELWEETNVQVDPNSLQLCGVGSVGRSEVYVTFVTTVNSDECKAGSEALQVGFFSEEECPWNDIAYPEISSATKNLYRELKGGSINIYLGDFSAGRTSLTAQGVLVGQ